MLVRASTSSFAYETAGAARIRHSLRPPVFEGERFQDSGASRREKAESRSLVVMPRFKRGIQYVVMSRASTTVSGILDRPIICS
jgi:hypothetical protein